MVSHHNDKRALLGYVYSVLKEHGYNPIAQIVGYLITGDPTYISSHGHARQLISQIDRHQLICDIVAEYLEQDELDAAQPERESDGVKTLI